MFKKLKKLLQGVVTKVETRQSDVERFIVSRNPSSVAEVEYWARIFDRTGGRGYYGY